MNVQELIWFKLGMMIDTTKLYSFFTNLGDLDLDSESQECENAKLQMDLDRIWLFCQILWSSYLFYLILPKFRGDNPALETFRIGLRLEHYQLTSFRLNVQLENTKLYCWYQLEWAWPLFKVTVVWESKNPFACKFLNRFDGSLVWYHDLLICSSSCKSSFTWLIFKEENSA